MNLLIVGTVAFDAIESPFGKTNKILGGAATYISIASGHLGVKSGVVSVVGDDFPMKYLYTMEDFGVNTKGIKIMEGEKTFFWSGKYHNDMNYRDTLVTELNVLEKFDPTVPESYKDLEYVMLGNLDPTIQLEVLEQMNRPKLVALDTMNFWIDNKPEELMKVISKVDVLIINDEEIRQITNEYSVLKAAKKVAAMGPKFIVVKKGEHGALLFDKESMFYAPALPLEGVFDPTGAGDTFAGGFMGHLASQDDISFEAMKSAVVYGSVLASFTVEKFGTERLVELKKEEIQERLEVFNSLTNYTMPND